MERIGESELEAVKRKQNNNQGGINQSKTFLTYQSERT